MLQAYDSWGDTRNRFELRKCLVPYCYKHTIHGEIKK
uniref:Ribosomal protein L33 n=1 Tax=Gentiana apiata TaxID=2709848 RepID=A0A6C0W0Y7_9GENT|nr:ribosomal protein L33 [Gentiana apiata]QIC19292.1 ribosomal protein L33 [Gentiana apiata]UFP91447.1 ribosomal protein L33 [Gentiana apiata]